MDAKNTHQITQLLQAWSNGEEGAYEELCRILYHELRRLARRQMQGERPDHTLNPSALANEVLFNLMQAPQIEWKNRQHLYGYATTAMRNVLVNYALKRNAHKNPEGKQRVPLDETVAAPEQRSLDDLLALDEALKRLAAHDARCAKVVELKVFGGLKNEEMATVFSVTERTIKRDWSYAQMWLRRELSRTT